MGCQSKVQLGNNLVFSVCTHDPDTGVLTDADDVPAWRLYEGETDPPILTGTMAKLDDDDTTGFYTEIVACTTGNGFESGKSYTIYITAAVGAETGGICYGFLCEDLSDADDVVDAMEVQMKADPTGFKVNIMEVSGTSQTANDNGADINAILDDTGTDGVVLAADAITNAKIADDAIGAENFATDALSADALSAGAVDEILDEVVEGAYTLRQLIRGIVAAVMNDVEDNGLSFRDIGDTKDRFTAVTDDNANRNVTIVDLT